MLSHASTPMLRPYDKRVANLKHGDAPLAGDYPQVCLPAVVLRADGDSTTVARTMWAITSALGLDFSLQIP